MIETTECTAKTPPRSKLHDGDSFPAATICLARAIDTRTLEALIQRLTQLAEVGIEGHKPGHSLKERLAARFTRDAVE